MPEKMDDDYSHTTAIETFVIHSAGASKVEAEADHSAGDDARYCPACEALLTCNSSITWGMSIYPICNCRYYSFTANPLVCNHHSPSPANLNLPQTSSQVTSPSPAIFTLPFRIIA